MKLFYYLTLLITLFKLPVFAQTTFWTEDFVPGEGWTMEGNWAIDNNKMNFTWSPQIENFDCSAISPVISLHESSSKIIVTQFLDVFSMSSDEMAEVSVIYENEEDIIWSYALSEGSWGTMEGDELEIPIGDYAGLDVQFKFRTYGTSTFNWNGWYIFEFSIYADLNKDLTVTNITGPKKLDIGELGSWGIAIKNTGYQAVSDYSVKLFNYKTGNLIASIDETESIEPLASKFYPFNWSSQAAYNTALYGVIVFEDDEFNGNNTSKSHFIRIEPEIDYNVMVWDNDNGISTIICPDQGDLIEPSTSLTRALDLAGIDYSIYNNLPDNLSDFDIIFSTMGCYCLS